MPFWGGRRGRAGGAGCSFCGEREAEGGPETAKWGRRVYWHTATHTCTVLVHATHIMRLQSRCPACLRRLNLQALLRSEVFWPKEATDCSRAERGGAARQSHRVGRRGVNEAVSLVGGRDMGRSALASNPLHGTARSSPWCDASVRRVGGSGGGVPGTHGGLPWASSSSCSATHTSSSRSA